jgi:hypothetical protein
MSRFTPRGRRGSQPDVTLAWEDGKLSGDEDAAMVRALAEAYEVKLIVFPGGAPGSRYHHLQNPWAAHELMCMVFQGLLQLVEGSLPHLSPKLPKQAVQ